MGGDAQQSEPSLTVPPSATHTKPPTTTTTSPVPAKPPVDGAPVDKVIHWIEAGTPAEPGGFHTATRGGEPTDLGDDVAFTSPSGKTQCMTDHNVGGELACLVSLTNPPPRPADVYGEWKGGWVDFDGNTLEVGSAHGDPGRFVAGTGPQLPYGQTLAFGDYRCRSDEAGVYCVNYAHQSAVRFSDAGIKTFGCLQAMPQPADVGQKFSC